MYEMRDINLCILVIKENIIKSKSHREPKPINLNYYYSN